MVKKKLSDNNVVRGQVAKTLLATTRRKSKPSAKVLDTAEQKVSCKGSKSKLKTGRRKYSNRSGSDLNSKSSDSDICVICEERCEAESVNTSIECSNVCVP